jgi:hypothetical protein
MQSSIVSRSEKGMVALMIFYGKTTIPFSILDTIDDCILVCFTKKHYFARPSISVLLNIKKETISDVSQGKAGDLQQNRRSADIMRLL